MKKLVSMLLIVGIIASLFTCVTVSADDTAVTGNAPLAMLDFSVKGSAEAAIKAGTVVQTKVDAAPIAERSAAYGGPGLEMNAHQTKADGSVDTSKNYRYAQAAFKFDKSVLEKDTYLKVAYMLSNVKDAGHNPGVLKAGWYWGTWTDSDVTWTPTTLPQDYVWKTTVIKIPGMSDKWPNDPYEYTIKLNFNGLTCKATIKYMALFDSKADAENYDPSISGATIQDAPAYVDHYNHTATVTLQDDLAESEIPDFSADDVALTLYNNTKYADQQGGAADAKDALALTTVTALSDKATYGKTSGYNYKEIQYKVSGTGMTDTIWSVRMQSKDASYIEPLQIIDFTNPLNVGKLVDPDGGSGKWRMTGTAKVGNTSASYFGSTVAEDKVTNRTDPDPNDPSKTLENAGTTTLNNWHSVDYDLNKIPLDKKVWVKIAYRFGDDAKAANNDQSKQFYIEFPNKQNIGEYGADNVLSLRNGWKTKVFECANARTNTDSGKKFYIGTFGIHGKIMIKYVAFFDNEEDAKNYKFGDIGATITTDGTTVNAIYDNAEVAPNGARVLALYQGDQLKKVVYSVDMDEISATGLEKGTYTAKAFYWNSLDEGYPKFDGAEATVTIN